MNAVCGDVSPMQHDLVHSVTRRTDLAILRLLLHQFHLEFLLDGAHVVAGQLLDTAELGLGLVQIDFQLL